MSNPDDEGLSDFDKGRIVVVIMLLGFAFFAMLNEANAEEVNGQENTSVSQNSSSMSNVQVNNSNLSESSYGGGVRCSETTLNAAVLRSFDGTYIPTVGISTPLFAGKCKDAADVQIQTAKWRLMDAKHAQEKKDELHAKSLERKELEILSARAQLAQLCLKLPVSIRSESGNLCGHIELVHSSQ